MKREDIHWLDDETEPITEEPSAVETVSPDDTPPPKRKRPDRKRSKKTFLIVLIVLCITGIGTFLLSDTFYNMLHHQSAYTLTKTDVSLDYTADGVTQVVSYGNRILRVNKSGIQALDANGTVHWDVPYSMGSPSISQSGEYIAVADLKGNQICLFNESGQIGSFTTEGPIQYCTVNENGYTAAILGSNGSNMITVYNRNGDELVHRETQISKDGIPVTLALNHDATCLSTSYIIYTETDLRSVVTLFNLTASTSQNADKIAGNYSYANTLITELRYMDDILVYVGDNRIGGIRTTGNTEQLWEDTLAYKIVSLDFGKEYLAVLFGDGMAGVSIGADSNLIAYSPEGTRLLEMNIESPETLNVSNDIIVYQDGITYNAITVSGTVKWYYTPASAPLRLFSLNKDAAVYVSADSIDIMKVTGLEETVN